MKGTATTLMLILALLLSTVAATHLANLTMANFLPADLSFPQVSVMSPENETYTNRVEVFFIARYNNLTFLSFSCALDAEEPIEIGPDSFRVLFHSLDGTVEMQGSVLLLGLADGPHKLTVYAKMARSVSDPDCAQVPQYVEFSDVVYFSVDSISPKVSILSPTSKTYNTGDIRLNFTVNKPVSWMGYSIDGQTSVTLTGNTTLTGLFDGTYSIAVSAKDAAGNMGTSETVYFAIDTTSPSFAVLSPENKTYATTDIPLNLALNEAAAQITYSLDGRGNVTTAGNTTLADLSVGTHNLTVYVTDSAGNTRVSETIYFSIEPFPTTLVAVAAVVSAAVVGTGLLLYFRKPEKPSLNTLSTKN